MTSIPASIFAWSRRSLTRVISDSVESEITERYSRCSAVSSVARASRVIPRMLFIGVRSSWLTWARNRLVASALSTAATFAARRRLTSSRRSSTALAGGWPDCGSSPLTQILQSLFAVGIGRNRPTIDRFRG